MVIHARRRGQDLSTVSWLGVARPKTNMDGLKNRGQDNKSFILKIDTFHSKISTGKHLINDRRLLIFC